MKKKIIVYDFDKTIYDGETGVNFSTFYLRKYPLKSILFLIKYSKDLLFYLIKIINLSQTPSNLTRQIHQNKMIIRLNQSKTSYWQK